MSSLNEYAANLNSTEEAERTYAAEDIGYLNAAEGVPVLLSRLSCETSRAVRDAIFQALIRIDADAAIEGCILLFSSDDPQSRNQAVEVLRRKGIRSISFLDKVMRDGDKDLRKLALDVLNGTPACEAREIYAAALCDPDVNVVITAVENLGRLRATEFRGRIEELLDAGAHPMLVGACLEALVGIGDASSLETIQRCFPDLPALPDFLLASCLKAMAALGSDREFSAVAGLLVTRGPHLRSAILGALIEIGARCPPPDPDGALLTALQAMAAEGNPPLCRYQAVRVLGIWATLSQVSRILLSCLSCNERLVRLAAAETLRRSGQAVLDPILAARAREESDEEVLQALTC